jgi:hypothetical protein
MITKNPGYNSLHLIRSERTVAAHWEGGLALAGANKMGFKVEIKWTIL